MSAPVRVRYAPSPTGYLHVGGARTALYNYLFARRHGGEFVLRIEDTDRSRYVPGAVERLMESLRWCGLDYDEGPDVGGPHGPYQQSQRLHLYRQAADSLLSGGHAYHCFCPPESVEARRQAQKDDKAPVRVENPCVHLSGAEVAARLSRGDQHTIRLRVPAGEEIVFQDLVRGEIRFNTDQVDDQVLVKSDGFPTYHLAVVVDDHDMRISHVFRGEEWLSSVPKHLLLYRHLGYELPLFGHFPLILNPDRSKLSKRQGDVAVEDYRAKGYLPEALINFVAFLGWNPGDEREIFSMVDLVRDFTIERVGRSGAVFNLEKLNWYNQQWLRLLPPARVFDDLAPLLAGRGWTIGDPPARFSTDYAHRAWELMRDRLAFARDFPAAAGFFFEEPESYDPATVQKRWTAASPGLLRAALPDLEGLASFSAEDLESCIHRVAEAQGVKVGDLVHPLRLACSGIGKGPGLYQMMEVLGREACLRRIRRALEVLPG